MISGVLCHEIFVRDFDVIELWLNSNGGMFFLIEIIIIHQRFHLSVIRWDLYFVSRVILHLRMLWKESWIRIFLQDCTKHRLDANCDPHRVMTSEVRFVFVVLKIKVLKKCRQTAAKFRYHYVLVSWRLRVFSFGSNHFRKITSRTSLRQGSLRIASLRRYLPRTTVTSDSYNPGSHPSPNTVHHKPDMSN